MLKASNRDWKKLRKAYSFTLNKLLLNYSVKRNKEGPYTGLLAALENDFWKPHNLKIRFIPFLNYMIYKEEARITEEIRRAEPDKYFIFVKTKGVKTINDCVKRQVKDYRHKNYEDYEENLKNCYTITYNRKFKSNFSETLNEILRKNL